jgi:hypothetical protein
MFDLNEMREAASRRLSMAQLEADVLEQIAEFGHRMDQLNVPFEVLKLESDRIEISVVIGRVGDPGVRAALGPFVHAAPAPEPVCGAQSEAESAPAPDFPADAVVDLDREIEEDSVSVAQVPVTAPVEPVTRAAPNAAKPARAKGPKPGSVSGKFSDDEMATIHRMLDAGAKGGEIAAALGRKPKAIGVSLVRIRKKRAKTAGPALNEDLRKAVDAGERDAGVPTPKATEAPRNVAAPRGSVPFAHRAGVEFINTRGAPEHAQSTADTQNAFPVSQKSAEPAHESPRLKMPPPIERRAPAPVSQPKLDEPTLKEVPKAGWPHIHAHLDAVGCSDLWTPLRDLHLALAMKIDSGGSKAAVHLKEQLSVVIARWKEINPAHGDNRHLERLIEVLRLRAGVKP